MPWTVRRDRDVVVYFLSAALGLAAACINDKFEAERLRFWTQNKIILFTSARTEPSDDHPPPDERAKRTTFRSLVSLSTPILNALCGFIFSRKNRFYYKQFLFYLFSLTWSEQFHEFVLIFFCCTICFSEFYYELWVGLVVTSLGLILLSSLYS